MVSFKRLVAAALLVQAFPAVAADYDARLDWSRRVELATPVSGVVTDVAASVGSEVKQGAALVTLDPRPFKASLAGARAQVAKVRETFEEAKREFERAQELYDRTLLSEHDLQLAKIAHTAAKADFEAAQAALEQARLELEYSVVRSPFDAIVVERNVQTGETVVSQLEARTLLVVADDERMIARAVLPLDSLANVRPGQKAVVRVGGRQFDGVVSLIGVEPASSGAGYPVEVGFATGERRLRAGQPAVLVLP